jgi:hypothetical protein
VRGLKFVAPPQPAGNTGTQTQRQLSAEIFGPEREGTGDNYVTYTFISKVETSGKGSNK